ncbi:MAG TPA: NAD(P)-binding domain-containing protein [Candidatus Dormibacteraeota bacterium]|nr:NAD(P)-binding domain-containing protein [Candidatus Dormibacteraeota bacterium]
MAELTDTPFPPGRYQLVVVGSGPGALQLTYCLHRLGVEHAVISEDPAPGGMFRRWPVFQRMLSWTKPYAGVDHRTREYERYDWNSLLADEDQYRGIMPGLMDGTSYFPSRPEMEHGLANFAGATGLLVRYGCRWETTAKDGDDFVLGTTDGEYRAPVVVFAVGVAEPWKPPIPGLEIASGYGEMRPAETYADRRVFIVGKQNSGFEIASALLPWARQIVLASPSPARLSVNTRSLVGVRARYVQPYEDSALAGGVVILDASIESVEPTAGRLKVSTRNAQEGSVLEFEVDDVIAATGFTAPLRDLPKLGVATFGHSRLPAQTPFWESATMPGIYFAGTIMQGAPGLRKHGIPSNSGAVQGYRYNARVLAMHIAKQHFGVQPPRRQMSAGELVPFLLAEVSRGPELWHQRSYLARMVSVDADHGINDEGFVPLAHFVDARDGPPDAVAITLESNGKDDPYPAIYIRRHGAVTEPQLMPPHPLLDFESAECYRQLTLGLSEILNPSLTQTAQ